MSSLGATDALMQALYMVFTARQLKHSRYALIFVLYIGGLRWSANGSWALFDIWQLGGHVAQRLTSQAVVLK